MKVKITYSETWVREVEHDIDESLLRDHLEVGPDAELTPKQVADYLEHDLKESGWEDWPLRELPGDGRGDEFSHFDVDDVEIKEATR